nr:hypothetical protein [Tanacetum cinerariifolium]
VDLVGAAAVGARQGLAAVAEAHKSRHLARAGVLEADLGIHIVFVADHQRAFAHVVEAHVAAPQPVAVAAVDLDPDRGVADIGVHQRQAGFVLA